MENAGTLAKSEVKEIRVIRGFLEETVNEITSFGIPFDFIILSSVLHELDEPQKMCEEN